MPSTNGPSSRSTSRSRLPCPSRVDRPLPVRRGSSAPAACGRAVDFPSEFSPVGPAPAGPAGAGSTVTSSVSAKTRRPSACAIVPMRRRPLAPPRHESLPPHPKRHAHHAQACPELGLPAPNPLLSGNRQVRCPAGDLAPDSRRRWRRTTAHHMAPKISIPTGR